MIGKVLEIKKVSKMIFDLYLECIWYMIVYIFLLCMYVVKGSYCDLLNLYNFVFC